MLVVAAAALAALAAAAAAPAAAEYGSIFSLVVDSSGNPLVVPGKDSAATAECFFDASSNRTGWNRLNIVTNPSASDLDQMRAAGYLEGYVTHESIWWSAYNWFANQHWKGGAPPADVTGFLKTNFEYVQARSSAVFYGQERPASDDEKLFWVHQYLVLQQLDAMAEGYAAVAPSDRALSKFQFFLLQTQGDIETLLARDALLKAGDPKDELVDFEASGWNPVFHEHCSSLVKHTDDGQELFAGHATWSGWGTMLRFLKGYRFNLANNTAGPYKQNHEGVAFSAYPATLSSIDDEYTVSQNIFITETTNGIMNKTLLAQVQPLAVLSWQRVIVANRLAVDGADWVKWFSFNQSGTYCNQWIVVDYNKFTPSTSGKKEPLLPGTITIAEQIPNYVHSGDVTPIVNAQGYWPSYNIPYFKDIFDRSGFPGMVAKYGQWFSHSGSPRAKIFKAQQASVNSLGTYQWIMRLNDYQTDPFSNGNAGNAVASRFDLVSGPPPSNPFLKQACFGAMDAKVTSYEIMRTTRGALGQSGPTFYEQPAFTFEEPICASVVHVGLPERFTFGWEAYWP